MKLTQPLKWFGGKHYLAKYIVAWMPRHVHYVEPYFGGGSVLLARDPMDEKLWVPGIHGVSELVNDIDKDLTNFWRVLRGHETSKQFIEHMTLTPMSRYEWDTAAHYADHEDTLSRAIRFFVCCRQSRAGMMRDFTPVTRSRTRRGMNGNVSEWLGAVDGLADVHARLRRVMIEDIDAIDLIRREDTPQTLFYLDPPYMHGTRSTRDGYAHEMSDDDHRRLLDLVNSVKGKVMISGYQSTLYERYLLHWRRVDFDLPNNAAGGDTKRRMTECLWMNY